MRLLALALLFAALPALASAQAAVPATEELPPRERTRSCAVLAKQIARFENVRDMARERGDDLWEASTVEHLGRLRQRQLERCPEDVPPSLAEQIAELLEAAGRIALTAATLGAL